MRNGGDRDGAAMGLARLSTFQLAVGAPEQLSADIGTTWWSGATGSKSEHAMLRRGIGASFFGITVDSPAVRRNVMTGPVWKHGRSQPGRWKRIRPSYGVFRGAPTSVTVRLNGIKSERRCSSHSLYRLHADVGDVGTLHKRWRRTAFLSTTMT